MKEAFWSIIEKFPIIGLLLNIIILLILPASFIFGLVRSIKRRNKIAIIIFSCVNFCYLLFFVHLFLSYYSLIKFSKISNQEFHNEMEQVHYYTIKEINPEFNISSNDNEFPIIKINEGIYLGGDYEKSFKFYNKPDYRIKGFVFYIWFAEIYIEYEFVPGHFYEINFEKLQKEYAIKSIGAFYYINEEPEQHEIWTDEMEDGINCLFAK